MYRKEEYSMPGSTVAKISHCQASVTHACNPIYLGRLRLGGSTFEASPGKKFRRPYLQNNQSKVDLEV
jgi:hypothetical protein